MKKKDQKEQKKSEMPAAPARVEPAPERVEFDVWHVMRAERIPGHHMKEILRADFRARGLGDLETAEDFDKALESYGVKLR